MDWFDKIDQLQAKYNNLLTRTKAAEDALVAQTCSGSEFFIRDGDGFRVDVPACVEYIKRVRISQHETIKRVIYENKNLKQENINLKNDIQNLTYVINMLTL